MGDRWVILMQASGPEGQVKMAVTVGETEPGPNDLAEYRGRISGYYRVQFGEWCERCDATKKNDAQTTRPTFNY